jgi:hypothetical protein
MKTFVFINVFWVVTPCGLVGGYQRFGGTYCLHHQGFSSGAMEATLFVNGIENNDTAVE